MKIPNTLLTRREGCRNVKLRYLSLVVCIIVVGCQRPGEPLAPAPVFSYVPKPSVSQQAVPPIVAPPREVARFEGKTSIYFDPTGTRLDPEARRVLDRISAWMLDNPQVTASLQGHAALSGTRERQFALGEMRASAMRSYLVARGVSPARLRVTSFGKQQPIAFGIDEQSDRLNSRGDVVMRGLAGSSQTK